MSIRVVDCRDVRNCRYIGRACCGRTASPLANPYKLRQGASDAERTECIAKYRKWLLGQIAENSPAVVMELVRIAALARTQVVSLGCWCSPKRCHGDVVVEVLEMLESREWFASLVSEFLLQGV